MSPSGRFGDGFADTTPLLLPLLLSAPAEIESGFNEDTATTRMAMKKKRLVEERTVMFVFTVPIAVVIRTTLYCLWWQLRWGLQHGGDAKKFFLSQKELSTEKNNGNACV
jgi:hypothetical protein